MIKRLLAIAFIFLCCSLAWVFLGSTVVHRTQASDSAVRSDVGEMWGGPQVQRAPSFARLDDVTGVETRTEPTGEPDGSTRTVTERVTRTVRTAAPLQSSDVTADLDLEQRQRGLLWVPTYAVRFDGSYRVQNDGDEAGRFAFAFPLPDRSPVVTDLALDVDGGAVEVDAAGGALGHEVELEPGESAVFRVRYGSQGVETWRYALSSGGAVVSNETDRYGEPAPPRPAAAGGVATARDVRLVVTTDADGIDFPAGTLAPTAKARDGGGWRLVWDYGTLVASADLGVALPQRLNPGPWVSRVTFFAPVSLFLFFFAVFVLSLLRGVRLHPMHYFFLGAACFAFHLLLAYLVDVVSVGAAMVVASAVSLALVVSYVRLVAGLRFALVEVGGAQAVYLVAFAATFFLEGFTGLAITLLSVATLFVTMQATGRLDWEAVLAKPETSAGDGVASAGPGGAARRVRPAPEPA
ncbi:inner membrane CreD family protein [Rubrivirga sp. S365]|uniref:Inner membrane CreD family protein n=1 Tax=Rubrivirga litoralis TaxID=3075598 RepID=A0ABU3BQT3_9BACT|nr:MULTISPECIES: inner membrane CreD family protein [unclassified Rubrivirga]MDT0631650.1 inner membrane CreD family protein [Rubrivirga sp. F394]MDT7855607.1 inner membrane CreD family protein [Rubrivirga sp. S365]